MKEIKPIYNNDSGTSFYWRNEDEVVSDKVQLIFRETGFYFTIHELKKFCTYIKDCYAMNKCCDECSLKNNCYKFLLKTPCTQIDLAVSMTELNGLNDLVEGTLFKINLEFYLYGYGMN